MKTKFNRHIKQKQKQNKTKEKEKRVKQTCSTIINKHERICTYTMYICPVMTALNTLMTVLSKLNH
jgi:hypothetical protein